MDDSERRIRVTRTQKSSARSRQQLGLRGASLQHLGRCVRLGDVSDDSRGARGCAIGIELASDTEEPVPPIKSARGAPPQLDDDLTITLGHVLPQSCFEPRLVIGVDTGDPALRRKRHRPITDT